MVVILFIVRLAVVAAFVVFPVPLSVIDIATGEGVGRIIERAIGGLARP